MKKQQRLASVLLSLIVLLMITACAGSEDESRGCLGSSCGDALDVLTGGGDVQIPSEGTGTSDGTNIDICLGDCDYYRENGFLD